MEGSLNPQRAPLRRKMEVSLNPQRAPLRRRMEVSANPQKAPLRRRSEVSPNPLFSGKTPRYLQCDEVHGWAAREHLREVQKAGFREPQELADRSPLEKSKKK